MTTIANLMIDASMADIRRAAREHRPLNAAFNYMDERAAHDSGHSQRLHEKVALLGEIIRGLSMDLAWQATDDGGIPRVGYGQVLAVAMREWGRVGNGGLPRKQIPHLLIDGWLGTSWTPWHMLTSAYRVGSDQDPAVIKARDIVHREQHGVWPGIDYSRLDGD